jgi:isopenicillin-N epimerase
MDNHISELSAGSKRRKFLKQLLSGSVATLAMPAFAVGRSMEDVTSIQKLTSPADPADERYWEMVKKQFTVPQNLTMLNAANLCPSPYFINDLVEATMKGLGKDVSFQYRSQFAAKRAKSLEKMAQFIGVTKEELGIVRNASEGNSIVVQGFDLKPGEEIILWDQNHPSNGIAWEQKAKRSGFIVKKVSMPAAPKSITELVDVFAKAITPKTRMISFSHISNTSGMALPAKEICQLAGSKKVLTLVDGAQSLGMRDLNLNDIGCDFYTASTHKWLMGPLENGILYMKKEHLERLWPNVISAGWKETGTTVDEKLCVLGQRNETSPFALPETIDFHLTMGKKNIEERVRKLNARLKEQIQSRIPQAVFVSPLLSEMTAGITIINLPGKTPQELNQKLYDTYGIACAPSGGVRMSPHIYNTMGDIDRVVEAIASLA